MTTLYHAKYFAHALTRQPQPGGVDRLSSALFDACVDLNPHQIEAALFALRSSLSKGVLLADEVGLGKTIEAGLVLCQYWAERKRKLGTFQIPVDSSLTQTQRYARFRQTNCAPLLPSRERCRKLLVICPASLRKQWSLELTEKFNLPNMILDAWSYRQVQREGNSQPFSTNRVVITSFNYASRMRDEVRAVPYDLVVIDEAHKLRNAYRPSNRMGQHIKWALEDRKKCLLTATPLQNSLLELYGLSSILDDLIFGDVTSFRSQYTTAGSDLHALRHRLQSFCRRTLRRQVVEYVQYTERRPLTIRFHPTDDEQAFYQAVSDFLNREDTLSMPRQQRHLLALILRKLLASSSHAIAHTLETMQVRLEDLRNGPTHENDFMEVLVKEEELEDEYLDEALVEVTDEETAQQELSKTIDLPKLNGEIAELAQYVQRARSIDIDTKSRALLQALELGFAEMAKMGANCKALVFTESRRTQEYLKHFLAANGYHGQLVLFNGTNADLDARRIIDHWIEENASIGRVTGSRPVDSRTALIEYFRDHATIMIATEAAAEGVNLQFCSLVLNYDLPWNPQRIEQRIGRCHRYGQKHDVVVINFLNERNEADRRVYELLAEKFNLFSGVFGASDEVLGQIESGVDFEKRILAIYQQCRTPAEIAAAFKQLQQEMDETIQAKLDDTRRLLLEHFDEDVHARLKMRLDDARSSLDRVGRLFWTLTRIVLHDRAIFDDQALTFDLHQSPLDTIQLGHYHLISKHQPNVTGEFLYRLSHPLGEWVIETGKQYAAPMAKVTFDVTRYPARISVIEALKGKTGWLTFQYLCVESFDREEYLLFSATDDAGKSLDQDTCEKLFQCAGSVTACDNLPPERADRLQKEAERHNDATITHSLEMNNRLFHEERERLERWADDLVIAAEKDLADTKAQLKVFRRQTRLATTLDEQHALQRKLRDLERKQRRQRQQIFDIEDEIAAKRDALIDGLQKRMSQKTIQTPLFTIQWAVV